MQLYVWENHECDSDQSSVAIDMGIGLESSCFELDKEAD